MQFIVSSKKLFTKLQAAAQVINKKNTLPILDCFLLGLRGNVLNIAATDGEVRLVTKIEVQDAEGDVKIAVNAQTLVGALKELPDQPITFEVNEDNFEVFIHYHNGKFNFIGQSGDDYPTPKLLDEKVKQELTIDSDVLLNGIAGTLFAVSDDELRPVMCSVYFDITKDDVTFVTSDGHRLVKLVSRVARGVDKASFALPTKGANVIQSLLAKQSDPVKIRFDYNNAVFDLTDYTVTVRFIDGRYPNYNSVIPVNNINKFTISKSSLSAIIKRVSVFASEASSLVKFDISNNALIVTAQDIDYSTAAEESTEISYDGMPMQIGFKYTFLLDLLKNIHSDEVEVQLSDPSRAALLMPIGSGSAWDSTYLLMPMQLND